MKESKIQNLVIGLALIILFLSIPVLNTIFEFGIWIIALGLLFIFFLKKKKEKKPKHNLFEVKKLIKGKGSFKQNKLKERILKAERKAKRLGKQDLMILTALARKKLRKGMDSLAEKYIEKVENKITENPPPKRKTKKSKEVEKLEKLLEDIELDSGEENG